MTRKTDPRPAEPATSATPALSRRTLFAGAGTVGALAAAAAVMPGAKVAQTAAASAAPAESSGGYQLTDHVKRYYRTARV